MPSATVPETDLARVRRWCAASVPARVRNEVRVEHHVRGRSVTLCETRVPWDGVGDWTHHGFAQLRYRPDSADWALYWPDRNGRWHEHVEGNRYVGSMDQLLAEVDDDPTAIFRG